MAARHRACQPA